MRRNMRRVGHLAVLQRVAVIAARRAASTRSIASIATSLASSPLVWVWICKPARW